MHKTLHTILVILIIQINLYGQKNPTVDSLKQELATCTNDSTNVKLRAKIGELTWLFRISYWDSIVEDAHRLNILKVEANALNNIGFILKNSGESIQAIDYFERSISLHKQDKDPKAVAAGYNNLADVYYNLGQTEKALKFHSLSLKIKEEQNDREGIGNSLNNIGLIYYDLGETKKALEYHKKAYKIKIESGKDVATIATALNNLGLDYFQLGKPDSAIHYFKLSLEMHQKENYTPGITLALNNIAGILKRQGKYQEALSYYQQSLTQREATNERLYLSQSYTNLADVYKKMGELQQAKAFGEKAIALAQEMQRPFDIEYGARILYKVYRELGLHEQALKMHELHVQMKDSLHNDKTKKAAVKSQLQYEYEKQRLSLEKEQEKKDLLHQEKSKRQNIVIIAVGIGLLLVLFFLYNLNKRFKLIRMQKETIEAQNQEIIDSITYAKRIQRAILPPAQLMSSALPQSFVLYLPKDIVAGDFYWLETVLSKESPVESSQDGSGRSEGETVFFAAADCTGHGVPGAMVSVVCNNGLNRSVREYGLTKPGEILEKTREIVIQEFEKSVEEVKDGMDIALCSLKLQATDNNQQTTAATLQYAGAHNPLWIIRKGSTEVEEIKADKQPIGKYFKGGSFTNHEVMLNEGDTIYVFSDGYPDQFGGEKGKKLKSVNFKKLLLSVVNKSMEEQQVALLNAFNEWKGEFEQLDDVCVIGVRV